MSVPLPDIPDDIREAYFEPDKYLIPSFNSSICQQQNQIDSSPLSYNQQYLHQLNQSQTSQNENLHLHPTQKHRRQNDQESSLNYLQGLQNKQLLSDSNSINTFVNDLSEFGCASSNVEILPERGSRNSSDSHPIISHGNGEENFDLFPITSPNFAFNLFNSGFSPLSNSELDITQPTSLGIPMQIPLSSSSSSSGIFCPGQFPTHLPSSGQQMDQMQFLAMLDSSLNNYDYIGNTPLDQNTSRGACNETHSYDNATEPSMSITPTVHSVHYAQLPLSIIKEEMTSIMEQTDLSPINDLTSLCKDDTTSKLPSLPLPWEETNMGPYKPLALKQGANLVMEMKRVLKAPDKLGDNPLLAPIRNIDLTPSPTSSSSPSPSSSHSSSSSQSSQKKHLFRSQLSTSSSRTLDRNVAELHKQFPGSGSVNVLSNSIVFTSKCQAENSRSSSELATAGLKPSLNNIKCYIGASKSGGGNGTSSSSGNGSESSTASSDGSPVTIPIGAISSMNSSQIGGRQLIDKSISLVQEAISASDGTEHQTWVDNWIYRGNSPVTKSGIEKQHEAIRINPRLDYQIREIIHQWTPYKPRTDRFFRITDKNGTSFNVEELKEMLEIVTSRPPRRINYHPAYQLCTDGEIGHGQTVTDWRHISTLHPSSSKTRQHIASPPICDADMDENEKPVSNLRKREGNIYEPTWVRGKKKLKEGWCDHCEGGFYLMKNSGYLYHKNHEHGIFPNGYIFEDPLVIRRKIERESKWEGLCGICYHWIDLDHTERKCWGTWYRHYKQCANEYEEFKKVLAATGAPVNLVELRYCPVDENVENN